jgi:DNA-3-methyladenine glycosylase II
MAHVGKSLEVLKRDKRFARLIKKHGKPTLSRYFPTASGVFQALLRSIIYQQLSGKAAASIHARFVALYPRKRPTPARVLATPVRALRTCGLSEAKVKYMKDVARKFADRAVNYRAFSDMSSEEIADHLCEIKGVGEWTAHMLLIFTLNRPDILPTGDLGIRKGFRELYGLRKLPNKKQMERLATPWRAHASVASWYLWRIADEKKRAST